MFCGNKLSLNGTALAIIPSFLHFINKLLFRFFTFYVHRRLTIVALQSCRVLVFCNFWRLIFYIQNISLIVSLDVLDDHVSLQVNADYGIWLPYFSPSIGNWWSLMLYTRSWSLEGIALHTIENILCQSGWRHPSLLIVNSISATWQVSLVFASLLNIDDESPMWPRS
jgi:hypothetical protein